MFLGISIEISSSLGEDLFYELLLLWTIPFSVCDMLNYQILSGAAGAKGPWQFGKGLANRHPRFKF